MSAWHRTLSEMLMDVFDAVQTSRTDRAARVWTRSLELTLPVEVRLEETEGEDEPVFVADVPAWRWRTVFDQTPSRLQITWEESEL